MGARFGYAYRGSVPHCDVFGTVGICASMAERKLSRCLLCDNIRQKIVLENRYLIAYPQFALLQPRNLQLIG